MSAIVNFIFRNKKSWEINIDDLLKTDNFIKNALKENRSNEFYT